MFHIGPLSRICLVLMFAVFGLMLMLPLLRMLP